MNKNLPEQSSLTRNSPGPAAATRKLVRERAAALAVIMGRSAHAVPKADWDQAKRELVAPDPQPNEAPAESAAESEGWGAAPASTGHHVRVPSGDDEDAEGRSDTERLVVEGVREAGDEQMRAASRPADNNP